MLLLRVLELVVAIWGVMGGAHTVITYPGWRGNTLAITEQAPYGMQWQYPCGGLPVTTNRTNWPVTGGAIAIQPGWFTGHASALFYINMGVGTDGPDGGPGNMSFPMLPVFQIDGPTDNPYPGTFCLPQVPVPQGLSVKVGDRATIQVIEVAKHGAGLFNCVDIIFTEPEDVAEVNSTNCFNSTTIQFKDPLADNCSSSPASEATGSTHASCSQGGRSQLFSTDCVAPTSSPSPAPVAATTSCPPSACPTGNGNVRSKEGLGIGSALGVLALGLLGL